MSLRWSKQQGRICHEQIKAKKGSPKVGEGRRHMEQKRQQRKKQDRGIRVKDAEGQGEREERNMLFSF